MVVKIEDQDGQSYVGPHPWFLQFDDVVEALFGVDKCEVTTEEYCNTSKECEANLLHAWARRSGRTFVAPQRILQPPRPSGYAPQLGVMCGSQGESSCLPRLD